MYLGLSGIDHDRQETPVPGTIKRQAEVHILDDEVASRAYLEQVWAEAMTTYKSGDFKLSFTPEMIQYLKEHQRDFMPEHRLKYVPRPVRDRP